jgi:hypothetical protein
MPVDLECSCATLGLGSILGTFSAEWGLSEASSLNKGVKRCNHAMVKRGRLEPFASILS